MRQVHCGALSRTRIPILAEPSDTLQAKYNRAFVLRGTSRLCAFYLPLKFSHEVEFRALYKYWEGIGTAPIRNGGGGFDHVSIPLGSSGTPEFSIELVEVQSTDATIRAAPYPITLRP